MESGIRTSEKESVEKLAETFIPPYWFVRSNLYQYNCQIITVYDVKIRITCALRYGNGTVYVTKLISSAIIKLAMHVPTLFGERRSLRRRKAARTSSGVPKRDAMRTCILPGSWRRNAATVACHCRLGEV
ncbi:hypothetical protein Trydic_g3995 [Trypoxylus dichotomus]